MSLATFAMEALADFRTVAAVAPSSRYLTRAMIRPLPLERARVIVELGPGTGVMTRALLNVLPRDAKLFAFEINSRFSRYLAALTADPRLVVINAPAQTVREELGRRGHGCVDAVVSSLGLALMSDRQRNAVLSALQGLLSREGVLTQFHYIHGMQWQHGRLKRFDVGGLLGRYFQSVQRTIIWRNLPPAFVFVCHRPVGRGEEERGSAGKL